MAGIRITRREFLRNLTLGAGATVVGQSLVGRSIKSALARDVASPVVVVKDPTATDYPTINEPVVQAMMDAGIKALARNEDLGEAWKSYFPGIDETNVISIKVNCINSNLS
ncbi:twin-arginine translocation signal domain-containing protein, partial [candidate division TA06 bacterium]